MKNKVSIIIPVYNTENCINKCLQTIVNQTYKNIEIIVIDDGSSDNSANICDKYENMDKRIKVIHKGNEGTSIARNIGINVATGNYIAFVDSDDYVKDNYIEILLKNILETGSDLSVCNYINVKDHKTEIEYFQKNIRILNKEECYNEMIINTKFAGYVWNKLYSTQILKQMNNTYFNEYVVEDFEFNTRYIKYCKKICYTEDILYYYYRNNNGITGSFKINDKILNGIEAYESILKEYDCNQIKYRDYVAYFALKYQLNINYRIHILNYKTDFLIINNNLYRRVMKSKIIKIKDKINIFITYKLPVISYNIKYKIKR